MNVLVVVGLLGLALGAMFIINSMVSMDRPEDNRPYANDGYTPPEVATRPDPIPVPETFEELDAMLYDNPFDSQQISAPIRCEIDQVDLPTASNRELQNHFNELTGCLMAAWIEPMTEAGWTLNRPSVTVYSGAINSPCGELPEMNAVYCAANQQLYFSSDLVDLPPLADNVSNPTAFDLTLAHEFGHSLQGRTGQLASSIILGEENDDDLLASRMREVQADCYAAMFINAASQSVPYDDDAVSNFLDMSYNMGSDVLSRDPTISTTHPHGDTRVRWTEIGLSTTDIGQCNPYSETDPSLTE